MNVSLTKSKEFCKDVFIGASFIALAVFVLIAAYATLDLVIDGMEYREKGYNRNEKDPLGMFNQERASMIYNQSKGKLKDGVKDPKIPSYVKNNEQFKTWYKTLTKAQQDAVKAKYLGDKLGIK